MSITPVAISSKSAFPAASSGLAGVGAALPPDVRAPRGKDTFVRQGVGTWGGMPTSTVPAPDQDLSRYYFDLGDRYYQANRFREAVSALDQVIQLNPQHYAALNKRGVVKAALKDYVGAIGDYTRAIAIKPDFYNAWINRGNLQVYVRDYAAALRDYGQAIRLNPLNPVGYENRAEVFDALGQRALALQDKAMVIQLHRMRPKQNLPLPYCPKRIALVLGNDDYAGTRNDLNGGPTHDAMSMRTVLQAQGFEVISGFNLTGPQMQGKVAEFIQRLQQNPGAVSLVYYSGHGGSINGNNYLIPTDYTGEITPGFSQNTVSVDSLLQQLKTTNTLFNMIFLDACRNPLIEASLKLAGTALRQWESEPGPGLSNTWIEYASRPQKPALQSGSEGLYTKYLLQFLSRPDLSLKEISMLTSFALEQDPIAAQENQHARTQTDLSRTEVLAENFYFARPC